VGVEEKKIIRFANLLEYLQYLKYVKSLDIKTLAEFKDKLPHVRVVTLLGTGGSGKTTVGKGMADKFDAVIHRRTDGDFLDLYDEDAEFFWEHNGGHKIDFKNDPNYNRDSAGRLDYHLKKTCGSDVKLSKFLNRAGDFVELNTCRQAIDQMISEVEKMIEKGEYTEAVEFKEGWESDSSYVPPPKLRSIIVGDGIAFNRTNLQYSDFLLKLTTDPQRLAHLSVVMRQEESLGKKIPLEQREQLYRYLRMADPVVERHIWENTRGLEVQQWSNNFAKDEDENYVQDENGIYVREKKPLELIKLATYEYNKQVKPYYEEDIEINSSLYDELFSVEKNVSSSSMNI